GQFALIFRKALRNLGDCPSLPVIIVGAISSDGGKPRPETLNVAAVAKPGHGTQKDVLNEIVYVTRGHPCQQNAVNHARVPSIQAAKCSAVASASSEHKRSITRRFEGRRGVHRSTVPDCEARVNS